MAVYHFGIYSLMSVFTFRRSDDFAQNLNIEAATAFDCTSTGEALIVAE
jgi:hypothetical protein